MPNKMLMNQTIATLALCIILGGCAPVAPRLTPQPVTEKPVSLPVTDAPPTATPTSQTLQPGEVRISKYPDNYTAFKIEVQGGAIIITDPYEMDEFVRPDIVTESHEHGDHTDISHLQEPFELIDQPGSFEFAGVKITGVVGAHDKDAGNEYNKNTIYIFDLGNIRIAEFASQGQVPSAAMYAQIGKVDILIIQVLDRSYKLSPAEAQGIASQVGARIIIPAHGTPLLTEEFAKLMDAEIKNETSGTFIFSRSSLDKISKPFVLVLDHP